MKKYAVREVIPNEVIESLKNYPETMRALLFYRGIDTAKKAEEFLNPNYATGIHDPFLMKDMDKAVERILKAIKNNEHIVVYSDYDADGIPAAVVVNDFFKGINYDNFEIYIPHRHTEGYGLHLEAIDSFKEKGTTLLITLDCGIVDHDEVKRASEHGIDIIITDHHLPRRSLLQAEAGLPHQDDLPPAFAVLNSKRVDCDYPYDMLCGSGVAFKLVQGLLQVLRRSSESRFVSEAESRESHLRASHTSSTDTFNILKEGQEKWLLDMVGLATLSDMVPLQGENRVLAHYGLKVIRKSRRPGLIKMLAIMKMNQNHITEDDIGFMITPRINAASRMGVPTDAFKLLSTTDEVEGGVLAEHLNKINDERKGLVGSLVKELKKIITERDEHYHDKKMFVIGNPNWRPAILGLAASNIVEAYDRPVFLWGSSFDGTQDKEDGRVFKGSCRSDGSVDLVRLMESSKHVFSQFGGHTMSGGFAVSPEKIHILEEELLKAFDLVSTQTNSEKSDDTIFVDQKLSLDNLSWKTYDLIEKLSPFGKDNPKPLFMLENIIPSEVKMFGKTQEHLEIAFQNSNRKVFKAIGFFTKPENFNVPVKKGIPLNLIATLEKSMFRSFPELRLRIVDII